MSIFSKSRSKGHYPSKSHGSGHYKQHKSKGILGKLFGSFKGSRNNSKSHYNKKHSRRKSLWS